MWLSDIRFRYRIVTIFPGMLKFLEALVAMAMGLQTPSIDRKGIE